MSIGRVHIGALAAALMAASQPAAALLYVPALQARAGSQSGIELVDARSYHHCHNMPRRTRCHTKTRLPVNWPPNTTTPSRNALGGK